MATSKRVRINYEVDSKGAKRGLDSLSKGTEEVRKGANASAASMANFAISARAGIDAARAAADALVDMAERASATQIALQNLPFQIDAARNATRGLADDLTLSTNAITAQRLGVVSTGVEYAELAEAATKLGLSVDQDANKSVQDLTTALARQSPMILDNLGITLKVSEANEEYAARIGKVASELTDAEKKQAFMTIGLERAKEAAAGVNVEIDDTAALILELRTEAKNFADEFSLTFLKTITETRNEVVFLQRELKFLAEDSLTSLGSSQEEAEKTTSATNEALSEGGRTITAYATLGTSEIIPFLRDWQENQRALNVLLGETNELQLRGGFGGVSSSIAKGVEELRVSNPNSVLNQLNTGLKDLGDLANRGQQELKGFFEEAKKTSRRRGGGGRGDPFAAERAEFQRQLTDAINAERRREFSEAVTLQRTYLQDVQRFEAELAAARQPSIDRFALEQERAQFLAEFQANATQRQLELDLARAQTDAEAFQLQQEAFDAKEAQLTREIEIETNLDEVARLKDERDEVRHQATLARIEREQRAREEARQRFIDTINAVDAAQNGSFQLSSTIADASIKGEERRKRVLDGIKAGELFTDGAVAAARAVGAYAVGNVPQGIALTAAAANYFAQGAVVAAGNARGGGGGVGGPTAAGAALGRGEQPERAIFQVDRGAPISLREDIEGNPNNTSGSAGGSSSGQVINIERIDVLGAIDDDSANKIRKGLNRAEANLGG